MYPFKGSEKMKRHNIVISIALMIGFAIWMLSRLIVPAPNDAPPQNTLITPEKTAVPLETKTVTAESYTPIMPFPAVIDSTGHLTLHTRISGDVTDILVKRGQKVTKNQILVKLSSDFVPSQYEDHKQKYELAKNKYKTDKKLFAQKLLSEYALKQSQNAVTASLRQLENTQKTYDRHYIRAPFDGVIETIHITPYQQISPNTPVLDLHDRTSYIIKTSLPVQALRTVKIGAEFTAMDIMHNKITGVISGITSKPNQKTGTYTAEGRITSKGKYNLGEPITIQINTPPILAHKVSLAQVVLNADRMPALKIVKDGIIELHTITILAETESFAWVAGLPKTVTIFSRGAGFAKIGNAFPPTPKSK